jgi:hypothetical protein
MKLLVALVVVLWWIALWGLTDLIVEDWTREQKWIAYGSLLAVVTALLCCWPALRHSL